MPITFDTAKSWYLTSRQATADWRDEAKELMAFVAGVRQWSEADEASLRAENRVPVVFNRIGTIVNAVCGSEINNRYETSFTPIGIEDAGVSEMLTSVVAWARHRCQADDEESDAFRDLVSVGMGWTHTRPDMDLEKTEVMIERVDPIDMTWDHTAKKRNLRDRRYNFRTRTISADDAEQTWPGKEIEDLHASWAAQDVPDGKQVSGTPGRAYEAGKPVTGGGEKLKRIVVVEAEWIEREVRTQIIAQGQQIVVDQDQIEALKDRLKQLGVEYQEKRVGRRRVYWRGIMGRDDWIEKHKLDPQKGGFRHKCMTGLRERLEDESGYAWYGMVRAGVDPQRWANAFFSNILHLIRTSALGGVLAEEEAFVNPRKAEKDWAKASTVIYTKQGKLDAIRERQPAPYPTTIAEMMTFAIGSGRECMGVNPELLGQMEREQPGVLEYQRRQAGMTVLAVFFDALSQYREEQGYLMLHMVLMHMADGRLVRITGERGAKYVPFAYQDDATDYDVKVSEAPSAPDQKQRMWAMIERMMPHLMQAQLPPDFWAEIIRYSPLPSSLAEKLASVFEERKNKPPSPEQQLAQQQLQADVQKTAAQAKQAESAAMLNAAKAQDLGAPPGDDQMLAIQKAMLEMGKSQADIDYTKAQTAAAMMKAGQAGQKTQIDAAKIGLERRRIGQEDQRLGLEALRDARETASQMIPEPDKLSERGGERRGNGARSE